MKQTMNYRLQRVSLVFKRSQADPVMISNLGEEPGGLNANSGQVVAETSQRRLRSNGFLKHDTSTLFGEQ